MAEGAQASQDYGHVISRVKRGTAAVNAGIYVSDAVVLVIRYNIHRSPCLSNNSLSVPKQ